MTVNDSPDSADVVKVEASWQATVRHAVAVTLMFGAAGLSMAAGVTRAGALTMWSEELGGFSFLAGVVVLVAAFVAGVACSRYARGWQYGIASFCLIAGGGGMVADATVLSWPPDIHAPTPLSGPLLLVAGCCLLVAGTLLVVDARRGIRRRPVTGLMAGPVLLVIAALTGAGLESAAWTDFRNTDATTSTAPAPPMTTALTALTRWHNTTGGIFRVTAGGVAMLSGGGLTMVDPVTKRERWHYRRYDTGWTDNGSWLLVSDDGRHLGYVDAEGTLRVFDAVSGRPQTTMRSLSSSDEVTLTNNLIIIRSPFIGMISTYGYDGRPHWTRTPVDGCPVVQAEATASGDVLAAIPCGGIENKGSVTLLDAATGTTRWSWPIPAPRGYPEPVLWPATVDPTIVLVLLDDRSGSPPQRAAVGLRAADGHQLWRDAIANGDPEGAAPSPLACGCVLAWSGTQAVLSLYTDSADMHVPDRITNYRLDPATGQVIGTDTSFDTATSFRIDPALPDGRIGTPPGR